MCRSRSGGIKTINMDRLGAHNAASAILNSQFIGIEYRDILFVITICLSVIKKHYILFWQKMDQDPA